VGKNVINSICLVACFTFVSLTDASASEGRITALASSFAFEDISDIFIFPQLLPLYGNGLYLNFANFNKTADTSMDAAEAVQQNISGGLIVGRTQSFGIFLNRPACNRVLRYSLLKEFAKQLIGPWEDESIQGTIVDAIYGSSSEEEFQKQSEITPELLETLQKQTDTLSDEAKKLIADTIKNILTEKSASPPKAKRKSKTLWGIGVRGSYWNSSDTSVSEGFKHMPVDSQYTIVELRPGLSFFQETSQIDMAARLNVTNIHTGNQGVVLISGVHVRGLIDMSDFWKLVILGSFEGRFFFPRQGEVPINIFVPLQTGGRFSLTKNLTASLLGSIEVGFFKEEGNNRLGIVIPSIELAGEYDMFKWLSLRAGLRQSFGLLSGTQGVTATGEKYNFNAGIGISYKNFKLDGVLVYDIWKDAPYLVSGKGTGLFAGVSASFTM
jgi:hypothetical protein